LLASSSKIIDVTWSCFYIWSGSYSITCPIT